MTGIGERLYQDAFLAEASGAKWRPSWQLWEEPPLDPEEAAALAAKRPPRFDIPSRRPPRPEEEPDDE